MKRRTWKLPPDVGICLALGVITLAVYAPCLSHEFLAYDDQQYVTENRHVQAGLAWPSVVWACRTFYASNWHPLTWMSHMLDCQLYGLNPLGHHLTNVLLHTANCIVLFLVLKRMTHTTWRSAAVAALFAWHPLHVESVAWIAERKDVLSGLFWMLTLWAYGRYAEEVGSPAFAKATAGKPQSAPKAFGGSLKSGATRYYVLALFFFALGLTSKPMLVTLPCVLLLLDFWPLRRLKVANPKSEIRPVLRSRLDMAHRQGVATAEGGNPEETRSPKSEKATVARSPDSRNTEDEPRTTLHHSITPSLRLLWEKLPFVALSAGCSFLTVLAQRQGHTIVSAAALPASQRIAHAVLAYAHYLETAFVPRNLAVAYSYSPTTSWAQVLGAAATLALISLAVLVGARRRAYLLVGWLWFLGTLVPVIGLVQVGDQAWADRYTYLPLIGLFLAVVWSVADLVQWIKGRQLEADSISAGSRSPCPQQALIALSVLAGMGMLGATAHQVHYWKDTRTLFERSAQVNPQSSRPLAVLGSLLAAEGRLPQAMDFYHRALALRSDDPEAHYLLGAALEQQGQLDQARSHYEQALWSNALQERTYLALGTVLAKQGKLEDAAAADRNALGLDPDSALAHNNLARVLHTQGRLEEAIKEYDAALGSDPTLAQAHNNLGVLLLQKGQLSEGAAQLAEAARLEPGHFEFRFNLATALNQEKQWDRAAEILYRLVAARPGDPNLNCQLALALAHMQKTKEAMSNYAQALLRQPEFPEALNGLAWILATDLHPELRNGEEAVRMAEGACLLTGRKQAPLLATLAAAYGEADKFPQAIAVAKEAQQLAARSGQKEIEAKCTALLEAFQAGQPWRETMQ